MRYLQEFPTRAPRAYGEPRRLSDAVRRLEAMAASAPGVDRPDRRLAALQRLQEIHEVRASSTTLTRREQRLLPWILNDGHPPVSSTSCLQTALRLIGSDIGAKELHGLVATFLAAPTIAPENFGPWALRIRRHLAEYDGRYDVLCHWKAHADLVFVPDAAAKVGRWCLASTDGLGPAYRSLRLPENSEVAERSLRGIVHAVAADAAFPARVTEALALVAPLGIGQVKPAVDAILQQFHRRSDLPAHDALINVAIQHLGDPRLKRNAAWGNVSENARLKLQSWISRQDLELFFKSVAMDETRRRFWLKYVEQMVYSRLVLGDGTIRHSDRAILEFLKQGRHATLKDPDDMVSAFIFQIKEYLFVEFSQQGDACYMYRLDEKPFSLELRHYFKGRGGGSDAQLKVRNATWLRNPPADVTADNRIIHRGDHWPARAAVKLQHLGIAPDVWRRR